MLGMAPAQQRLESRDALIDQIDRRLIVQLELVALDGVTEIALDRHPPDQLVTQRDVEHLEATPAELLRVVIAGVGIAQHNPRPVRGMNAAEALSSAPSLIGGPCDRRVAADRGRAR